MLIQVMMKKHPCCQLLNRSVGMSLKCFFNSRDRYLDEWKALLAAADRRYVLHRVYVPEDSLLGIIEIYWDVSGTAEA